MTASMCTDPSIKLKFMAAEDCKVSTVHVCPLTVSHLVSLPADYSQLINQLSTFDPRCIGEDSRVPVMCLVCGEVVCSQGYCCQTDVDSAMVGAATLHAPAYF